MDKSIITVSLNIAKQYHKGQKYNNEEYIFHLLETYYYSKKYIELINTDKERILSVALLHDILEDTDFKKEDLLIQTNSEIAECVQLLTKTGLTKEEYYDNVIKNKISHYVKLCDRMANVNNAVLNRNEKKIDKYKKDSKLFTEKMKGEFDIILDEINKLLNQ